MAYEAKVDSLYIFKGRFVSFFGEASNDFWQISIIATMGKVRGYSVFTCRYDFNYNKAYVGARVTISFVYDRVSYFCFMKALAFYGYVMFFLKHRG